MPLPTLDSADTFPKVLAYFVPASQEGSRTYTTTARSNGNCSKQVHRELDARSLSLGCPRGPACGTPLFGVAVGVLTTRLTDICAQQTSPPMCQRTFLGGVLNHGRLAEQSSRIRACRRRLNGATPLPRGFKVGSPQFFELRAPHSEFGCKCRLASARFHLISGEPLLALLWLRAG
jgi:hypothetical protein